MLNLLTRTYIFKLRAQKANEGFSWIANNWINFPIACIFVLALEGCLRLLNSRTSLAVWVCVCGTVKGSDDNASTRTNRKISRWCLCWCYPCLPRSSCPCGCCFSLFIQMRLTASTNNLNPFVQHNWLLAEGRRHWYCSEMGKLHGRFAVALCLFKLGKPLKLSSAFGF